MLVGALGAIGTAHAQEPTLPTGAPASLTGVVHDRTGAPLGDVSVTLIGEVPATRTDSAGAFTLRDVAAGPHTVLFRKLGYRSVEYRWSPPAAAEVQVSVTMTPVARELDRVVVEAPGASRRRGTSSIGGMVIDSTGRPVAEADVRLIGAGLSTATDPGGHFQFRLLAAGTYIVRVRRHGSRPANAFMQIVDDDNREISVKLFDVARKGRDVETESGYGITDVGFDAFDRRSRSGGSGVIVGPADLIRANRLPLDQLLQRHLLSTDRTPRLGRGAVGAGAMEDGDCLLIDGRRAVHQPLRSYTSLDVQLVEAYRANAFVDSYIVSQMESVTACRGSMQHHPSYFVLWTRSVR